MLIINNEIDVELPDMGIETLEDMAKRDGRKELIEASENIKKQIEFFKSKGMDIYLCLRYDGIGFK